MADPFAALSPVMEAMHDGYLVLTPNHRTYVQLLDFYGCWRQEHNLPAVCLTPDIHPVDIWIRTQWQRLDPAHYNGDALILEPAQEALVWQDIIQDSEAGTNLVNIKATARSVQEAWQIAHLWKIEIDEICRLGHYQKTSVDLDDLLAFTVWVESFIKICNRHSVISLSQVLARLIDKLESSALPVPDKIIFAGFREPPPLYSDLIRLLENRCSESLRFACPPLEPVVGMKSCRDREDEFASAAFWARNILAEDPGARIGIICMQKQQHAFLLEKIFRDALEPGYPGTTSAFSISRKESLGDTPVVSTALSILALNETWIDTLEFCRLLRSPFIEAVGDEVPVIALEMELRESGEQKFSLSWIRELTGNTKKTTLNEPLSAALLEFDSIRRQAAPSASCAGWCDIFEQQLKAMGWPGVRPPDKREASQLKGWSLALKYFKQSSNWSGKISWQQALARLRQLTAFVASADINDQASIQVLAPVEADGLLFTHLWVTGLSEQHWPQSGRPSPFISLGLQKKAGIPDCDLQAMTEQARQQLLQFRDLTGNEVVFSYPCHDEGLELKPAGMLQSLFGITAVDEPATGKLPLHQLIPALAESDQTELLRDNPTISPEDDEIFTGGVSLIADQADCPFRAFAKHRLGIVPLPAPVIGLPGNVLGSILHEAMERFWKSLKNQQHLLELDTGELEKLTEQAVTEAVRDKSRFYRHTMTARFIDLEILRLKRLLLDWLEEEKLRGSFAVVASEYKVQWQHAQLTLNLRIDRLDETPEAKLVIVDYKSPKSSEINWTDERQTEPQLMLYMLAVSAKQARDVDGLFIAQINVEECRYKGISNDEGIYPKSLFSNKRRITEGSNWESLKVAWQESLTEIANEFLSGYAAVSPKSINSSCTWCHLGGFCRINEIVEP